ncbi:phosphoglycerate mutase-like protein isoform X2 [Raphanus sativus]|uniref:Phosphoglycerate mutase-like protein isoform X2 n=1 Tax=Raphanus sativus TaxID=3726 RepID=A0A9W3DE98_RAPSA|nr:phosphoglycerate mutase-like protein isoform X2 [Raphanus sativus]
MDLSGVKALRNFKTIHLVRHAQGIHNVGIEKGELESYKLLDACLSPMGIQQVSERRKEIIKSGLLNTVQLVITSPLRRAMQTSVGIFRGQEDMNQFDIFPKVNNSPPIVALEICRERMGLYPCDKRESIGTYRTCFSEIDFTMSDEDALWAEERENMKDVSARGLHFLKWLWERPEKDIAVVSHGIFLQQTLRALHEIVGTPVEDNHLKRFANCELRSIRLDKSDMEAYTLTTYNC